MYQTCICSAFSTWNPKTASELLERKIFGELDWQTKECLSAKWSKTTNSKPLHLLRRTFREQIWSSPPTCRSRCSSSRTMQRRHCPPVTSTRNLAWDNQVYKNPGINSSNATSLRYTLIIKTVFVSLFERDWELLLVVSSKTGTWRSTAAHITVINVFDFKTNEPCTKRHVFISILVQYGPKVTTNTFQNLNHALIIS